MLIRLAFHPKACSKILRALMKKIRSFTESMVIPASGSIPEMHWRRSPSTRGRHRSKVSLRKDRIDQIPIRSSSRIHGDLPECRRLKRRSRVHIKKASINGPRFCRDRDNLTFPGNVNERRRHGDFSSFMIRIGQEAACNNHDNDRAQGYPLTCGDATKNSSVTGSAEGKGFSQTFKDPRNHDSSLACRTRAQDPTEVCSDERIGHLDAGNMNEKNMSTYAMLESDPEAHSHMRYVRNDSLLVYRDKDDLNTDSDNNEERKRDTGVDVFPSGIGQENACRTKYFTLPTKDAGGLITGTGKIHRRNKGSDSDDDYGFVGGILDKKIPRYADQSAGDSSLSRDGVNLVCSHDIVSRYSEHKTDSSKRKSQKNILDPVKVNAQRRRRSRSDGCSFVIGLDQDFHRSGDAPKKSSLWGERTNHLSDSCSLNEGRRYGGFPSSRIKTKNGPEVCCYSDQAEESSINASESTTIPDIETLSSSEKQSISSEELTNSLESAKNRDRFAISGFYSSSTNTHINTHIDSNVGPSWIHAGSNEIAHIHQKRDVGKSISSTYGNSSSSSSGLQCDFSPIYRDSSSISADVPSESTSRLDHSSNITIELHSSKYRSNSSRMSSNSSSSRRSCASSISTKLHGSDWSPEHRDLANIPANSEVLGSDPQHLGLSTIYPNLQDSTLVSSEHRDSSSITVGSLDLSSLSITSTDLLISDSDSRERRGLISSMMSTVLPKSDNLTSSHARDSSGSNNSANLPRSHVSSRHIKDPAESIMSSEDLTSRSLAIVKLSENPAEDFRQSMREMMMTMTMGSEEMEELLRCYLTLNSPHLHDLIQEVFCDVWCTIS